MAANTKRNPLAGAKLDAVAPITPARSTKRKQRSKLPISERATLTIEETAQYLGIGRQTAYDEARTGGLPVLRLGRRKKRIVVVRALLDEMILRRGREAWGERPTEVSASTLNRAEN